MKDIYSKMQSILQKDLFRGWQDFRNGQHFKTMHDFALFLDGLDEFQKVHRKKLPHPPHEFAARFIGIPFMDRLMSWGLFTSHWFPGDYYYSKEVDFDDDSNADIHARVFNLKFLANNGKTEVCNGTLTFPHLHDDFGFLEPIFQITEKYIEPDKLHKYLPDGV